MDEFDTYVVIIPASSEVLDKLLENVTDYTDLAVGVSYDEAREAMDRAKEGSR